MSASLLSQLFPTPSFLLFSSVGLELSDHSITFAELVRKDGHFRLGRYGAVALSSGIIEGGMIRDEKRLVTILGNLARTQGLSNVRISLPGNETYLFELSIPRIQSKKIEEIVRAHISVHTPFKPVEALVDYKVINESPSKLLVHVVVSSALIAKQYISVCKQAGLTILSCEPKTEALARALIKRGDKDTSIIVDFGERETELSFVSNEAVVSKKTVPIGGRDLTEIIEKYFNVSQAEATRRKRVAGLSRKNEHLELSSRLLTGAAVLKREINEELISFASKRNKEGNTYSPVSELVLSGSEATIPHLAEYLSSSLRLKVRIANPWINIDSLRHYVPDIHSRDVPAYAGALGLALHSYE